MAFKVMLAPANYNFLQRSVSLFVYIPVKKSYIVEFSGLEQNYTFHQQTTHQYAHLITLQVAMHFL